MSITVRPAARADAREIYRLLCAFGAHMGHPDWVTATPDTLEGTLFGGRPGGFAHVAEADGAIVGAALWFVTFTFWYARPILYLEDLFVDAEARGSGAGAALMQALAAEAVARDCAWMDWQVLTDNTGGQRFYDRLGARIQPEWRLWRLEGEALRALAAR